MRISLLLLACSFLGCCQLLGQSKEEVVLVEGVRGEYSLLSTHSDISSRDATERARDDAKNKALFKVCGETTKRMDKTVVSNVVDEFESLFIKQTSGKIVGFDIIEEAVTPSEFISKELCYYCIADVRVKKGVEPDPDFIATVDGIKSFYFSGDKLSFQITPYRDCFLKVFLFENDNKTAYLIYPNDYDLPKLLHARKTIELPHNVDFVITKDDELTTEHNRIVFVFTKSERPFSNQVLDSQTIEHWIAQIPNDEIYVYVTPTIDIRDN